MIDEMGIQSDDVVETTEDIVVDETEENTESESDVEDNTESEPTESEEPAWEYPDFIPDDLVVPEEFASPAEELEWYRTNYFKAIDSYRTDSFKSSITENYRDFLISQEGEVEKLKALKEAFDGNPRGLFKHYFGTELESAGVQFKLSQEEKNDMVVQRLSDEFGDDYYKGFDPEQVDNPRSLSYRLINRQKEIMSEIEKATNTEEPNYEELIEESYEKEFADFDRKEYDDFIANAKSHTMTMKDIYNAVNFEKLREKAYNDGVESAKKALSKELNPQTKRMRKIPTYTESGESKEMKPLDKYASNFMFR